VRDEAFRARAKKLFALEADGPSRQEVVTRYEPLLTRHGQSVRGAAVFEKHCLTCHSMQGRGQRVGPDLSGVGARPRETLLVDLFDPGRQVAPDFVAYTLLTRQGQVLTGLVVAETATSVTLRRADGAQDIVPRAQIEELRGTGKSLMPEGLESTLSEENIADLLEFLARPDARLFSKPK
jgi:putative heme-binding domain-containing protein